MQDEYLSHIFEIKLAQVSAAIGTAKYSLNEANSKMNNLAIHQTPSIFEKDESKNEFGISIYTLLHLHVEPTVRQAILKLIINFPFWSMNNIQISRIRPWNIYLQVQATYRQEIIGENEIDDTSASSLKLVKNDENITEKLSLAFIEEATPSHQDMPKSSIIGVIAGDSNSEKMNRRKGRAFYHAILNEFKSHPAETAGGK